MLQQINELLRQVHQSILSLLLFRGGVTAVCKAHLTKHILALRLLQRVVKSFPRAMGPAVTVIIITITILIMGCLILRLIILVLLHFNLLLIAIVVAAFVLAPRQRRSLNALNHWQRL